MKQVIVIPARMKGTRLPGKPLIDLNGKPMIYMFGKRPESSSTKDIYIATEDAIIKKFCDMLTCNVLLLKSQILQ